MSPSATGARQGNPVVAVKDKASLYNAYMPYLKQGASSCATPKRISSVRVFSAVTLRNRMNACRSPQGGRGTLRARKQSCRWHRRAIRRYRRRRNAKGKIETLLAGTLNADKHTHTMGQRRARRRRHRVIAGRYTGSENRRGRADAAAGRTTVSLRNEVWTWGPGR